MIKVLSFSLVALVIMVLAGCGNSGPSAPTGLTVTSTSPITLSWTAVSGAKSYSVYRGTTTGGISSKTRLAFDITVTTYIDASAIAGTVYYYQVVAVNTDGVSAGSNEIPASQSGGSSFTVVGNVVNSTIKLTWSTVSNASTYNVYRGTTPGVPNKIQVGTPLTTTTFTDTTGSPGVTYYYQVTAVNSSGVVLQTSSETPALSF